MLYLITITTIDGNKEYTFFDTYTESVMTGHSDLLAYIIDGLQLTIKNLDIVNGKPKVKYCSRIILEDRDKTNEDEDYTIKEYNINMICLCKKGNKFKIVNENGEVSTITEKRLKDYIKKNQAGNCFLKNNDTLIEIIDNYEVIKDNNFEEKIANDYKSFVAKAALLGHDITFKYSIENDSVRLDYYTGKSKDVTLPNFITDIRREAFEETSIETLKLNQGLKRIGSSAFLKCNLSEVKLPESVEIVHMNAFGGNKRMFNSNREFKEGSLKSSNTNLKVLPQILEE